MPIPTIANFFGISAQVITASTTVSATGTAPKLIISQSDFTAEAWNALTSGHESDPQKWLTAIILKVNAWSIANTDDLPNVAIDNPIVGLESRNNALKRRFSYSVDIYQPDTGNTQPDPDLV